MADGRGPNRAVGHNGVDRHVADRLEEARLEVLLAPRRIEGINELLRRRVRDGTDLVRQRRAEGSERSQETFAFFDWAAVADGDSYDRSAIRQGNEDRPGG